MQNCIILRRKIDLFYRDGNFIIFLNIINILLHFLFFKQMLKYHQNNVCNIYDIYKFSRKIKF